MSVQVTQESTARCYERLRQELLDQRLPSGHWVGHLSSSALATATAISALAEYRKHALQPIIAPERMGEMIDKGITWLLAGQNQDGGWGDTPASHSNVATTLLVMSTLNLCQCPGDLAQAAFDRGNEYCEELAANCPQPGQQETTIFDVVRARYGKDKTFAVPILSNCAIGGLASWSEVAALPCEAALVPQKLFRFINLPVVSYAIPALVAIGQAKFLCDPPRNPLTRVARRVSVEPGMRLLTRMQPESGGFLEAIPLTSFVAMNLAHSGRADHPVTGRCVRFIDASFRDHGDEGTWPIDTNLATWVTTLSINALGSDPREQAIGDEHLNDELLEWLLACQYQEVHPFTGAAPGGWGWSDLSGSVPDADDTPGALLALRHWRNQDQDRVPVLQQVRIRDAATRGVGWLLDLQNRDKGWPTFCRGWGRLPFDRSGNDITAHVLRALLAWQQDLANPAIAPAIESGFDYLRKNQDPDGSWSPLWFGNQDHPHEDNPVYGTTRVLLAWRDAGRTADPCVPRALNWILDAQNEDGGWGGGTSRAACSSSNPGSASSSRTSSFQETALVCEILASCRTERGLNRSAAQSALHRGIDWMIEGIEREEQYETWPIGFYFAKLWYYEALYPLIFATSALRQILQAEGDEISPGQETGGESNFRA